MVYVNYPRPSPPDDSERPQSAWSAYGRLIKSMPTARLRAGFVFTFIALLTGLVILLALLPPYEGLAALPNLQLARITAPLHTYLFRNAVINSGLLLLGVYLVALPLGWTWAVTGVPFSARPMLLLPLLYPGALLGLLWRPLFGGWLDLAQAEISLLVTGVIILWRAVPLAAWHFSWDREAWPKFIPLCALIILLDGALILTLTGGEPFNAAHTWTSWLLQQLWASRAWGYAASMAAALAALLALMTWWASLRTPSQLTIPHGSPLGLIAALVWMIGPFIMPLFAFLQVPLQAMTTLVDLGALLWLVNGLLLWGGITWLGLRLAWRLPNARARLTARVITVAMLPVAIVALAYLSHHLPILRGPWIMIPLTSLFSAGLLMGEELPPSRRQWLKAAGYSALVLAFSFPLQLVMQLPTWSWTPILGSIWTLAEAPDATAALGVVLIGYGVWAGGSAYILAYVDSERLTTKKVHTVL
jgi:hypothetical protein